MKKLILITLLCIPFLSFSQQKSKPDTLLLESWEVMDKDSVKLFYGLSPLKITTMPVEEIKAFLARTKLPVSKFYTAKIRADNYLTELKIKKDSIELIRIYDRIEQKLGLKKSNGNHPTFRNRKAP